MKKRTEMEISVRSRHLLLHNLVWLLSDRISCHVFDERLCAAEFFLDVDSYEIFYFFWGFYDDFHDSMWSAIYPRDNPAYDILNRTIGQCLLFLTSEENMKQESLFSKIFRHRNKNIEILYPFSSQQSLRNAIDSFKASRYQYIPKIITMNIFELYIKQIIDG